MPNLTPVKVRGKRKLDEVEKCGAGEQKFPKAPKPACRSHVHNAAFHPRQERKHARLQLSRLEQLPAELIQAIFVFSENVNLPLSSRQLHYQLTGAPIAHEITTRIIDCITSGRPCSQAQLEGATRLMSCRFFTYSFFQSWLVREFDKRGLGPGLEEYLLARNHKDPEKRPLHPQTRILFPVSNEGAFRPIGRAKWTWESLSPDTRLLPPLKLFRPPFTKDKILFLHLLAHCAQGNLVGSYPSLSDLLQTSMKHAVSERSLEALALFTSLRVLPSTDVLRHAVINAGCDRYIILELIYAEVDVMQDSHQRGFELHFNHDLDLLDPTVWAWAEEATRREDPNGQWLKETLRAYNGKRLKFCACRTSNGSTRR